MCFFLDSQVQCSSYSNNIPLILVDWSVTTQKREKITSHLKREVNVNEAINVLFRKVSK